MIIVRILKASVKSCNRCGGSLSTIGLLLLAMLTSACTAAGMTRLQSSQRSAVAICGAAEAIRAAGGDHATVSQAEAWCRSAIRLAAAETTSAAIQLEEAINEADDAGIEVPAELRAASDAGALAPAGVTDNENAAGLQAPAGRE